MLGTRSSRSKHPDRTTFGETEEHIGKITPISGHDVYCYKTSLALRNTAGRLPFRLLDLKAGDQSDW